MTSCDAARRHSDPPSGSRIDLEAVHAALEAGDSLRAISDDHFEAFIKFHRGIQHWRLLHQVRREWEMEVWVLYGPTGTGKTQGAWAAAPEAFLLPPGHTSGGVGWWDGYDGQADIIIDEFYGWLKYSFMLQLLDRYPLRVETKGGSVQFVSRRIFLTSNKPPTEWYDPDKFAYAPLERRLTRIVRAESLEVWYNEKS